MSTMSHQEVVKLIKCESVPSVSGKTRFRFFPQPVFFFPLPPSSSTAAGPFVALTLQGPPPSAAALPLEPLPMDLAPNQRASLSGEAPPSPPPPMPSSGLSSTPSQRITGPKPLQVTGAFLTTGVYDSVAFVER